MRLGDVLSQAEMVRRQLLRTGLDLTSGPGLAAAMERLAEVKLPQPLMATLIRAFARAFDVDLGEAAAPVEAYPTLNAFFTRELGPGVRPIDADPHALLSPADGHLSFWGRLDVDACLPPEATIKDQSWSAADLVGRPTPELANGHVAVVYLSPRDYHRVHSPVSGTVEAVIAIPGARYPVNGLGLNWVPGLFTRNLRTVFVLNSNVHGRVFAVMVGATNVGRITSLVAPGAQVAAGDALGIFNLGSTVVLLRPEGPATETPTFDPHSVTGRGLPVRMGTALTRV
jgi:phosphatidylserine decarboxylase